MAGYYNYSMSNNARAAYANGERPLSRWTKEDILRALDKETSEKLKALTVKDLRRICLRRSSWHHTSSRYNKTDFYTIDIERAEEITAEEVEQLVADRKEARREAKEKKPLPAYITALVQYTEWEGTRAHPKPVNKEDIVYYRSGDKMITCPNSNAAKKRLSSLDIIYKIEQKTKYAKAEVLLKKLNKKQ